MTTNSATVQPTKKRQYDTSHLKPYQFGPGNHANDKGRPKAILTKKERLELLSEMAKMNKNKANPVEAIREHNRMEGVYPVQQRLPQEIVFRVEFTPRKRLAERSLVVEGEVVSEETNGGG